MSKTRNAEEFKKSDYRHSPLPWQTSDVLMWTIIDKDNLSVVQVTNGNREERKANAEFIVEACNEHWRLKAESESAEKTINARNELIGELQAENEELKRDRCEHCGTKLNLDGCLLCGAPVCCPHCCQITSFEMEIEKLEQQNKELVEALENYINAKSRPHGIKNPNEIERTWFELLNAIKKAKGE